MNTTNFIQTGGFPMDINVLDKMQTSWNIFNGFGELAGPFTIIKGCVENIGFISAGLVYINGELLDFQGGELYTNATVTIIEEPENKEFENGTIKEVHFKRYARLGVGTSSWLWSEFKRVDPISLLMERILSVEKKTAVFQSGGGMVFWNKPAAEIPVGWQEVVDWRGRIPAGLDITQSEFNVLGKTGGAKSKTLSIAEMPAHTHDFRSDNRELGNGLLFGSNTSYQTNVAAQTTAAKGGSNSFSLMNPYRVVMFIEYIE